MQAGNISQDSTPEDKLYTYVIIPDDLHMDAGKMAAQVSHASRLSLLEFVKRNPHRLQEFLDNNVAGSVAVLRAKNEAQLQKTFMAAKDADLPTALFTDSGHVMMPFFDGSPVVTALAIGPAERSTMRAITKKFQVVRQKLTLDMVEAAMKSCEQTSGMNMLEHGQSVYQTYTMLISILQKEISAPEGWRIPEWAYDPRILDRQLDEDIIRTYLVYHDCGKPYTRTVDENGKVHYPGHAEKSAQVWKELSHTDLSRNHERNDAIAKLMGMDMDIHTLKADGIEDFARRPEAATLLLAGLAEVHSNAGMFGGFDSTSFKIKAKHLNKMGKRIVETLPA